MNVILLDNDRFALDYLEEQLLEMANVTIVGKYLNPLLGKARALSDEVDVVFLDVNLGTMNGVQLAEQILEVKPSQKFVFVTAYYEYAIKAFELNAVDYILKPACSVRLTKTLQRIQGEDRSSVHVRRIDEPIMLHVFQQVTISAKNEDTMFHWRTTKAQEMFLYLLQHRGQLVRKSVLLDLLWPEYDSYKVSSQLYSTVYQVRRTLEPYRERLQIERHTDGYILKLHNVIVDAKDWERRINSAPPISDETIKYYEQTMRLYTGDYLQEYDFWWAEGERHRLKMLWLNTALLMARWYQNAHYIEKAVGWYQEICNREPQAEEAHFALISIYASIGNHIAVDRQYRLLVKVLQEELSERPSPYIDDWYHSWKQTRVKFSIQG
ncbi:response regulator [Paenibacillus jiagnxiensis]|uniref:response regulator n=1 Tax=Paenibacillus jiagnxiensis TaxID=3228926 RepID=UPI0033A497AD